MKKFTIILFLMAGLILPGCLSKSPAGNISGRIVSGIDIYCQKPTCTITRHYTNPEKVEAVLHCIRLWHPKGPVNPEKDALQGDLYEIVVYLENGTHRIYRQRAHTFAAKHLQSWGRIDGSLGLRLPFLMTLLPSDPLDVNDTDIPKKAVRKS